MFYEWILFGIWYSEIFHERILFGIRKFFTNGYIRYSIFENFSWTNTIRYSEILHGWIYSVFGIQPNSLFGATLQCIRLNKVQKNEVWFWKCLSETNISNHAVIWQTAQFEIFLKIFQLWMFSVIKKGCAFLWVTRYI